MSLLYLVDGYNLIHHPIFSQRRRKSHDLRLALLNFIRAHRLSGSTRNKLTIVFDGYPPEGIFRDQGKEEVIFSLSETADERIKRIILSHSKAKDVVLVSDDRELKDFASINKARALSAEEFLRPAGLLAEKVRKKEDNPELTNLQMQKINVELRRLWLKED